jgi:hypothetical protein
VVCGVKRGWRTRLHVVRCTSDITWAIRPRTMGWAGRVARMGEKRKTKRVLVGKPNGKGLLGRPRRGWEDCIKMIIWQMVWEDCRLY